MRLDTRGVPCCSYPIDTLDLGGDGLQGATSYLGSNNGVYSLVGQDAKMEQGLGGLWIHIGDGEHTHRLLTPYLCVVSGRFTFR